MNRLLCQWILTIGLISFLNSSSFAVTKTFSNPEDSYVRQTSPTTNYGSDTVLLADGVSQDPDNGKFGEVATLIKWDISSIPPDASITSVKIKLNITDSSIHRYNIYNQTSPWDENSVTWNDMSQGSVLFQQVPPLTVGQVTLVVVPNAVDLIQKWVNGVVPNNGVIIRNMSSNNGIDIDSKETPSGLAPTLEVSYTTSGITGHEIVLSDTVLVPSGSTANATATCPEGKVVTGGGFKADSPFTFAHSSFPTSDVTWRVEVKNQGAGPSEKMWAYAVCADEG